MTAKTSKIIASAALPRKLRLTRPPDDRIFLESICRDDFPSFLMKCFNTLRPGATFLSTWHVYAIAYHLELVRLGQIRRLIINAPPRTLKSFMSSVAFPAFVLGHDPTKRIIAVSYGSELANALHNEFRTIMRALWYQRLFPSTQISQLKNTECELATTQNGFRLATSIDGTLTGRGGDLVVIDDPLKASDVLSDSKRDRVNEWFSNTLLSRLDDKRTGAIVLVMQRLHCDDLTGTLLLGSEPWTLLSLPAIAEQDETIQIGPDQFHTRRAGDVLHPEREPSDVVDSIRSQVGSDTFAAQYQQAPVPPGGAMIKRHWVQRYDQLPVRDSSSRIFQSWDTACKAGGQNDWSVCTTWLVNGDKYYLMDVLRDRFDYPTLKAQATAHAQLHRPGKILIEDAGIGTALIADLLTAGFSAIAVKPEHNKRTRLATHSVKFEGGNVLFPNQRAWLPDLETELFAFPNVRHDDQVDSISQALAHKVSGYEWTDEGIKNLSGLIRSLAW